MNNKRGLSDVITNVLIILLVLIAVGIIASFVIPLLRNTGDQITDAQECLNIKVNVAKCSLVLNSSNGYDSIISVNREAGASSAQFKEVRLILENQDGTTRAVPLSENNRAGLVELITINQRINGTGQIKAASVAVVLNESQNACPASSKVNCVVN